MEASPGASFFIADKLRGIPLVTGGTRQSGRLDESSTKSSNEYQPIEDRVASNSDAQMQPVTAISLMKLIQTTKRPTTTTAKPSKAPKTTTIAKPVKKKPRPAATTTSTTTERPQINRLRLVPVGGGNQIGSGRTGVTHQRSNNILAKAALRASANASDVVPQKQNVSSRMVDASPALGRKLNLTNLELAPVNQRRAQQSVIAPRFINKPNDRPAGENWKLFNRLDGHTSLFEGMALGANVMIVSTIVLVIIVNWVRALRWRRRPAAAKPQQVQSQAVTSEQQQQQQQASPSPLPSSSGTKSPGRLLDGTIEATQSAIGSAASSAMSNLANITSGSNRDKAKGLEATKGGLGSKEQMTDQLGSSQRVSNEIKNSAAPANKATAIVQPSENLDMRSMEDKSKVTQKDKLDDGQLKKPEAQIHRSASDLSSGQSPARKSETKTGGDDANKQQQNLDEKLNKLGDLFKGSEPILNNIEKPSKPDGKKKQDQPLVAASSLESVELPNDLVATIKQAEGKDVIPQVPSPNLLLGETGAPKDEQAEPARTKIKAGKNATVGKKESELQEANSKQSKQQSQEKKQSDEERPENPMGRQIAGDQKPAVAPNAPSTKAAEVKSHQVVVNKLDKRKTNLEIVDLRDESVTGKMRSPNGTDDFCDKPSDKLIEDSGWISMDGVAVVQAAPPAQLSAANQQAQLATAASSSQAVAEQVMSPSEIIDSRFNVDYASQRRRASAMKREGSGGTKDSMDSKVEEQILNNIENELELNNDRLRNRKYFVYIVNDGHFTAKKECIARIELPPKRRITLAEMRQLITNSKDISLLSLRRNKFKFVTETYRLLNENEDATVLHQVYPTQGVFLKLNVAESESQAFTYKGRNRGSSNANLGSNTLSQTTIASRRRANSRAPSGDNSLPAIEVEPADGPGKQARSRAASVGRRGASQRQPVGNRSAASYGRSKSNVQVRGAGAGAGNKQQQRRGVNNADALPPIDLPDELGAANLEDRRSSFSGTPLADMSDDKMRIITASQYCSRASCGRLATIRCNLCNMSYYCSVQCRLSDWLQHKQFCKKPRWRNWG